MHLATGAGRFHSFAEDCSSRLPRSKSCEGKGAILPGAPLWVKQGSVGCVSDTLATHW